MREHGVTQSNRDIYLLNNRTYIAVIGGFSFFDMLVFLLKFQRFVLLCSFSIFALLFSRCFETRYETTRPNQQVARDCNTLVTRAR